MASRDGPTDEEALIIILRSFFGPLNGFRFVSRRVDCCGFPQVTTRMALLSTQYELMK